MKYKEILKREFTLKETAEILQTDPKRITAWVARGIIKPYKSNLLGGRKKQHIFNFVNLARIAILKFSSIYHMHLGMLNLYLDRMKFERKMEETPSPTIGLCTKKTLRLITSSSISKYEYDEDFIEEISKGSMSFLINLENIKQSLLKRING